VGLDKIKKNKDHNETAMGDPNHSLLLLSASTAYYCEKKNATSKMVPRKLKKKKGEGRKRREGRVN
jgi:hypothetical protein